MFRRWAFADGLLGEQHPYEVPEVLVLAPESGSAPYLAWLAGAQPPAPKAGPPMP